MCQACLAKQQYTMASEVDHIKPKAKGGTDDLCNLRAICTPCHRDKTTKEAGGNLRAVTGPDGWPV